MDSRSCQEDLDPHTCLSVEQSIARCSGQMSNVKLLDDWSPPELDPPVIVEDEKYTTTPTKDENIIAECILELARSTRQALDDDFDKNNRYCRRIRLDHLNDRGEREELPVLLPYEAFCWNSYDTDDIVIMMIEAIRQIDYQNTVWCQMRVLLDDFMDPLVYRFIEVLDRSESADDIDFEKVEKRFRRAQLRNGQITHLEQNQESTPAEQSKHSATASQNIRPNKSPRSSEAIRGLQVINLADEDDDCIIIE